MDERGLAQPPVPEINRDAGRHGDGWLVDVKRLCWFITCVVTNQLMLIDARAQLPVR